MRSPARAVGARAVEFAVVFAGALLLIVAGAPVGGPAAGPAVGPATPPAGAAALHRAAVIVDTGSGVHRTVVTFSEDSITGLEALRRAGADPVVWTYSGQGGAVCRLYGVGRDAGPNCLGGQDGDARYWAYFRAPSGTTSFKYSPVCACTAQVHGGDVEGWRWGTGQAPPYSSVAALTGPPPTQGTAAASSPAGPAGGAPRAGGPAVVGGGSVNATGSAPSTAAPDPATATTAPGSTSTTPREEATIDGRAAASRRPAAATRDAAGAADHGSALSLLGFGVVITLLAGAVAWARRRRRWATIGASPEGPAPRGGP